MVYHLLFTWIHFLEKNSYSACPMILMNLHLPTHIRKLAGATMLTGLIPGQCESKFIDPYIVDVLVDDIMHLNTYDGSLKANIVFNVFDYPGQYIALKCQGMS